MSLLSQSNNKQKFLMAIDLTLFVCPSFKQFVLSSNFFILTVTMACYIVGHDVT